MKREDMNGADTERGDMTRKGGRSRRTVAGLRAAVGLATWGLIFGSACGDDSSDARPTPTPDTDVEDVLTDADLDADVPPDGSPEVGDATDADTGEPDLGYEPEPRAYSAEIRRTENGVPHILADDIPSVHYGLGYAFAEDHVCTLAEQIVRARSEYARYFGPGPNDAYIDQDFGVLALGVYEASQSQIRYVRPDIQDALLAYVRGYNQYLNDTPENEWHSLCRGEPWVMPITDVDLYAYYLLLGERGSGIPLLNAIGTTQPPGRQMKDRPRSMDAFPNFREQPLGSNGWAIGRDLSASGRGMLLANPHFPFEGELTWYESHLTVPGELNVYGASLMGVLAINLGFNEHVAWTHTVSGTPRFTLYRLDMDRSNPMRYRYDDEFREITGRDYEIEVLTDNGLQPVERTLYRSHYGPMVDTPLFRWGTGTSVTMRNANEHNHLLIEQWWEMNHATSMEAFQAAHANVHAVPWVYTMATDTEGDAWFVDSASAPRLSTAAEAAYVESLVNDGFVAAFADSGAILLNGSDSLFEWEAVDGTRVPGLVPFDEAPQLLRTDFVANANDSHWLTNPAEPLEGYAHVYGSERTIRSLRTRMNLVLLTEEGPGTLRGEDGRITLERLRDTAVSGRSSLAELAVDGLLERCVGVDEVTITVAGESVDVDITEPCEILAEWDRRYDPDSVGVALFRETMSTFSGSDLREPGVLFDVPFDPADPVNTPRELVPRAESADPADDRILRSLAARSLALDELGFLDAPLRETQFTRKGDDLIPYFGGTERDGTIAIASWVGRSSILPVMQRGRVLNGTTGLTEEGYIANYGNSVMIAMEFTDDGPRGYAFVTYGNSSDPESPHFADQTLRYAEKDWRTIRFTESDIAADPALTTVTISYEP